jgi:hypothetical protein
MLGHLGEWLSTAVACGATTELKRLISSRFFPSLHLYAFDTLVIPTMSAEYERVFSSTKKLLTPERSRLAPDIIEVSECLKNWWDRGLARQLEDK